ncbi:hypothetical protein [Rhodococcus kunmingensis]|uniref:hypothetical protein n=1 Tax=Aldersonia kunmingensis TaxID=408066 RepID=UPI0008310475
MPAKESAAPADRADPDRKRDERSDRDDQVPESENQPDSPTGLTKQSWSYVLRRTARELNADQCTDLAAAL